MAPRREPLEIAFLGCGRAARTHARLLRSMDRDVRLRFAGRDPARTARFAGSLGGAHAFASYEDAILDKRVGVVVVTTPPDRHLDLTLAALAAGKDVVVEKPAFFAVSDFGAVREAADRAGRQVLVAENYFYKPLRGALTRLLADGVVGEPLLLRVNAVKRQVVEGWRADRARVGGGGLFEGGIHWINLMSNLGAEVESASGYRAGRGDTSPAEDPGGAPRGERSVEESLLVVLRYRGGMVGTLSFSWEVPSPLKGVRISTLHGREGSAWFESNGIFLVARGARTRWSLPGLRDLSGSRAMWLDFLQALRNRREPAMTLHLAERDVRFVRDVYRSITDDITDTGTPAPDSHPPGDD